MNLQIINKYFTPNSILDIGANVGQFYDLCQQHFPKASVLSIEANILCYYALKKRNPNSIIKLLDKKQRISHFFLNKDNMLSTGSSVYRELTKFFDFENSKCISLKTDTLDNILPHQTFDLIKLDTQGSEIDILNGGKRILKRCKGIIVEVSHKPYNLGAPLSYEVVNFMLDNNFLLKETLATNSKCHQSDFFFINEWWYEYYAKIIQE